MLLVGLLVLLAAVGVVLGKLWLDDPDGTSATDPERANPVEDRSGVANLAFYYDGKVPLEPRHRDRLRDALGHPAVIVSTPRSEDGAEIEAIHDLGALAYRYVQFYWAPTNQVYEGINLREHPDWAFCLGKDSRPAAGRTVGDVEWLFLDANEEAVRERIRAVLAGYADEGWDGVFFDRGQAATQYAFDADEKPLWYRESTCTEDPHRSDATFADAYVDTLGLTREVGLQAMVNNGISPFDPEIPMRPDPRDPDCQQRVWSSCDSLGDVWDRVNLVLTEASARPRLDDWDRTFSANQRSEQSATNGRRTVALITTATLGGERNQTRSKVFYQWSRVRLFNLSVAVNTGDDRCEGAAEADICNRYGSYPDLTDIRFGGPLSSGPAKQDCEPGSSNRCVWVRRYADGASLINATGQDTVSTTIELGVTGCRWVKDVFTRKPLAGNRCVTSLEVPMDRWTGHPLIYSRSRF